MKIDIFTTKTCVLKLSTICYLFWSKNSQKFPDFPEKLEHLEINRKAKGP